MSFLYIMIYTWGNYKKLLKKKRFENPFPVTYPLFYCNNCDTLFQFGGKEKNPCCRNCRSRTTKHKYPDGKGHDELRKYIVKCFRCGHLWLMDKDKYRKRTHCPKCKFHKYGKNFYWTFINLVAKPHYNDPHELKHKLLQSFPKKRHFDF